MPALTFDERKANSERLDELVLIAIDFCREYIQDKSIERDKRYELARSVLEANKILVESGKKSYLKNRFEILKRDDFKCVYCGRSSEHKVILQIDHIIAKANGGNDDNSNLVTACFECNIGKRDFLLDERQEKKFSVL